MAAAILDQLLSDAVDLTIKGDMRERRRLIDQAREGAMG
jgi:hypothetical protein